MPRLNAQRCQGLNAISPLSITPAPVSDSSMSHPEPLNSLTMSPPDSPDYDVEVPRNIDEILYLLEDVEAAVQAVRVGSHDCEGRPIAYSLNSVSYTIAGKVTVGISGTYGPTCSYYIPNHRLSSTTYTASGNVYLGDQQKIQNGSGNTQIFPHAIDVSSIGYRISSVDGSAASSSGISFSLVFSFILAIIKLLPRW